MAGAEWTREALAGNKVRGSSGEITDGLRAVVGLWLLFSICGAGAGGF